MIDEVLDAIQKNVSRGAVVADLMCGTGSVALKLREAGFRVIANDIMTYSYHHARTLLCWTFSPEFDELFRYLKLELSKASPSKHEALISHFNGLKPIKGYFWKEFCKAGTPQNGGMPRNYFTPENASRIDAVRKAIRSYFHKKLIDELEHSLLLHELIMATNNVANIAGTYGHYMAKNCERSLQPFLMKPSNVPAFADGNMHQVFKSRAEDIADKITCDLCYIDPPYMKRQYAANYHILETLAREDEPEAVGASGLRPWRDQYSNFCTKTKIFDSFEDIIQKMQCKKFLVSYSEDGLIPLDTLALFLKRFGKVRVSRFQHKRFRSNNSPLASTLTEYLIDLTKR